MIAHSLAKILTSKTVDKLFGDSAKLFFKCENFQKVLVFVCVSLSTIVQGGAFKMRGACNALLLMPDKSKAVVTHSSGNHAQALALAATTSVFARGGSL